MAPTYKYHGLVAGASGGIVTAQSASHQWVRPTTVPFPEDGRIVRVGGWITAAAGSRIGHAVYLAPAGTPTTLIAATAPEVFSAVGNAETEVDVSALPPSVPYDETNGMGGRGFGGTSVMVRAGELVAYSDVLYAGSRALHTYQSPDGYSRYSRYAAPGIGDPPSHPFAQSGISLHTYNPPRQLAMYAVYVPNRSPATPTIVAPANGFASGLTTPTVQVECQDPDRADDLYDYLSRTTVVAYDVTDPGAVTYHGRVDWLAGADYGREISGSARLLPATVDKAWNGAPLVRGRTYALGVRCEDEFGARSPWAGITLPAGSEPGPNVRPTAWTHTIFVVNAGSVVGTSPVGTVDQLTGLTLAGTYQHPGGVAAASVRVRLLRRGAGTLYVVEQEQFGATTLTPQVGVGATISVPQPAEWTLGWSADYATEWRIVDADGIDGGWTGRTSFATNRAPNQPANLAPPTGSSANARPAVSFDLSDVDDTAATGLVGRVEIVGTPPPTVGYEVDAQGWVATAGGTGVTATQGRTTETPRTGVGAYRHQITASTQVSTATRLVASLGPASPIVPGRVYRMSAWARGSTANLYGVVGIEFQRADGQAVGTAMAPAPAALAGTYQASVVSATPPPTATQARPLLATFQRTGSSIGTVTFDDVAWDPTAFTVRDAAPVAGSPGRWAYQTTAVDLPSYGDYAFVAYGHDGTLDGPRSAPIQFAYQAGPIPTVTDPPADGTVGTATPTVQWTVAANDQNRYRVQWRPDAAGQAGHDSGWVTAPAIRAHSVPTATPIPTGAYTLIVELEDAAGLRGSATRRVTVAFPGADPVTGLVAEPIPLAGDDPGVPSAVILAWNPVDTATENLASVELAVSPTNRPEERTTIVRFVGAAAAYATSYLHPFPPSGEPTTYAIRQVGRVGGAVKTGPWSTVEARIDLRATILASVVDPEGTRMVFRFWERRDLGGDKDQDLSAPAGSRDPVAVTGRRRGLTVRMTARIVPGDDGTPTVRDQKRAWLAMDEAGDTVSYRDETGAAFFGVLADDWTWTDSNRFDSADLDFSVTRTDYQEGVAS